MALLTACIVREDEKRSYDPYEVVLGALLHDIGYAGTVNKAREKPVDGMMDMEKQYEAEFLSTGFVPERIRKYGLHFR